MKNFIKAVGNIDDELLERYESIEKSLVPAKKRSHILKTAAIAACLCVIIGSVVAVLHFTGEEIPPIYSGFSSEQEALESSRTENQSLRPNESSNTPSRPEQSGVSENTSNDESFESGASNIETSNTETSNNSSNSESSSTETSNNQTSSGENSIPEPPPTELNTIYSGEPLWLNPSASGNAQDGGSANEQAPPYVLFGMGITAMGRVTEVSPDIYARLGASAAEWRYRVAVIEITEAVYGKNLPDKLYIMIPSFLDANALLKYDEIMFSFRQKGFENYVLANETQKRAEAFSMMFETIPGYAEFSFVPFTDGVFDISLWREKGWKNYFYEEKYMLNFFTGSTEYPEYLIKIGYTVEQAKESVLNYLSDMYHMPLGEVLYNEIFDYTEARTVIEYCKPFENGIFSQKAYVQNGSAIFFERFIYGFATNEMIRISETAGDVTYYGEKFTEEEIEKLPNIADFFENTDIDSLSPMHTDITDKLTVSKPMIAGKYIKHDGKIYSVARIGWKIEDDRNWYCNDNTYFLIAEDGSATLIEREELRTLVGNDDFITSFKYNDYKEQIAVLE